MIPLNNGQYIIGFDDGYQLGKTANFIFDNGVHRLGSVEPTLKENSLFYDGEYTEKEKSQASDSFKRACFNWGIGRELYSAPFIWIPAGKATIQMKEGSNKEKRYYCNERFSVISIAYSNDREISALVIHNDKGQIVYELKAKADMGRQKKEEQLKGKKEGIRQKSEPKKDGISKEQMASLQAELKRTGVAMEAVQERYKITAPESMNEKTYKRVMEALAKTKAA